MIRRSRATGGGNARTDETTGSLSSNVDLEELIPVRHPLRKVREIVNDALVRENLRQHTGVETDL